MKSFVENLKTTIKTFCQRSSAHGLIYLVEDGTNLFIKIFWLIVVIFGLSTATILFETAKTNWYENPTITTLVSSSNPVSEVQFPTVTVCQEKQGTINNW